MDKEIDIRSVTNESLIKLDLKGKTKEESIDELIELLYLNGSINDRLAFKQDVLLREEEGMTGIGDGIAIPHGKSDSVIHTSMAIGVSDHDIEWGSLDDKPVTLIIMLAIKSYDKTAHIRLLSRVASSLCEDEVIKAIKESKDKSQIIEIFERKEVEQL